jgi:uncharacterized protein (TIGR03083 family)
MTPAYPELVAAIRREGEQLLAVGQELDLPVPTCPGWTLASLLAHVGSVYRRAATVVEDRATAEVAWQPPPDDLSDPTAYLTEALDDLVQAFRNADADTPVWNWSGRDQRAAFWARRMTHESAVHRFDAQRARGVAQPIDSDIAIDGLDELVDIIAPRVIARDRPALPVGRFAFASSDDGQWTVQLDGQTLARLDDPAAADVTVRGTASALLLAAYSRVPWTSLEVEGDRSLLDAWSATLRF